MTRFSEINNEVNEGEEWVLIAGNGTEMEVEVLELHGGFAKVEIIDDNPPKNNEPGMHTHAAAQMFEGSRRKA